MRRTSPRAACTWPLAILLTLAWGSPARPQDAGPAADAGADAATVERDPRIDDLQALAAGTLDVRVTPESLFDIQLTDEIAVQIEIARVGALSSAVAEASKPHARARRLAPDAGIPQGALFGIDPNAWNARLELDRARLEFYRLDRERRDELLRDHAERVVAARPRETEEERRARETEAERQQALEAARAARTEAERLVGEELARLIELESRVSAAHEALRAERTQMDARRDSVLGWQRRARDAKSAGVEVADTTHDALRRTLRTSREDLAAAMTVLESTASSVPSIGPDPIAQIPAEVPTDQVRERRASVERSIAEAKRSESALREERAAALLDEITALNRERLGLLPFLSNSKRSATVGFTAAGWDQARAEGRQLSLILRYHRRAALGWLDSIRHNGTGGLASWSTASVVFPLALLALVFVWLRRRTPAWLRLAAARFAAEDRAERRASPSLARRAVDLLTNLHRSLEWLALYAAVLPLIPAPTRNILELQLLFSATGWILGGALIVNGINALASVATLAEGEDTAGELRLRSLRLVGRTVVVFVLILVLSTRLVGEGTIYSWVFSTCWFAALPVFLLLVRWWRGTVFERMDRLRKKTSLQAWVLSNRSGWKSFLAAMVGALQLFLGGSVKTVRGWISSFDLARRAHAYLFKRELERMGEGARDAQLRPLDATALAALHPEHELEHWIDGPSDDFLADVERRLRSGSGALIALIGPRGAGKSSVLRALIRKHQNAVSLPCSSETSIADVHAIVGTPPAATPELVLLDDAHTLLKPVIGGLAGFDEITTLARSQCKNTIWILALDASLWPFLRRARDARPVFDATHVLAPWDELQIGELLAERCKLAAITPSYDGLLERLPPGSDELDRLDALQVRQAGYERMLWDHVGGNPGLALEAWRSSLAQDPAGIVHVRPLNAPDVLKLELLPDSSLFVLRAVLQLAPAAVDDVAQATRLTSEQVLDALRFGQTQGVFSEREGRYRVAWRWLRQVTRLLERRHLLVSS